MLLALIAAMAGIGCASNETTVQRADDTIRVMSFNLRRSNPKDTLTGDGWLFRRAGAVRVIHAFGPDLLGTQEGFHSQVEFLGDYLPGMAMHGVGRDDGRRRGEFAALFYRTARFEPLDGGHRWLSPEPDRPGSRTWGSKYPRMVSWVVLRDRRHDRTLLVVDTHFDHLSAESRAKSAVILRDLIAQHNTDGVVLTGDFNCDPGSEPYQQLVDGAGLVDTFAAAGGAPDDGDTGTRHGFRGTPNSGRIDWVLVSTSLRVLDAGIDRSTTRDRRYPSDHFPVTAVVEWSRETAQKQ